VQTFFQAELQRVFASQFDRWVAPTLRGARPVKANVRLKQFDVPSVLRRVLVDQYAKLDVAVDLVDPKTNASILLYPGIYRQQWMWGGLGAPIAEAIAGDDDPGKALIGNSVSDYARWLVTR
jgi:hypothetical protein